MKHTKKPYTFRLEPTLIKQLDSFSGTRTYNVDLAIQKYVQNDYNQMYNSNTEAVQILKNQVADLQTNRDNLQRRLDYYTLPFYRRLFTPRLKQ